MLLGVLLLPLLVFAQISSASRHPPPPRAYNVLILSPIGSQSHQALLMPMAVALADRGHLVTMLTGHEVSSPRETITVLTHGLKYTNTEHLDMFKIGRSSIETIKLFPVALANMSRDLYHTPVVAELYQRKDEFDVVIIDFFFNEVVYPFGVGKPFISASVCCNDPVHSMSFGNSLNSAYFSHSLKHYLSPLSSWERIENFIISLAAPLLRYWITFIPVQYHISRQFPGLPSLGEIEKNQSVAFINSHSSIASPPKPLLPGQVEIGGIHCREGRPLPQKQIDGVTYGVYMVSHNQFGTFRFAYFAAHPNVKLFITHGGTFGLLEALYHSTPMLAMPVFSDQPKNAMRIQNLGIGLTLSWDDVSEERITESITKIITEPQYQKKISEMSVLFKDRPDPPSEQVVYWTEFAVRHGKVKQYRSPEYDLSQIQLLHFDVFAVLCLALYLL